MNSPASASCLVGMLSLLGVLIEGCATAPSPTAPNDEVVVGAPSPRASGAQISRPSTGASARIEPRPARALGYSDDHPPEPNPTSIPDTRGNPRGLAKDLFSEGVRAFQSGDVDQAILDFKTAYVIAPMPAVLVNIAKAYETKRDTAAALFYWEKCLQSDDNRFSEMARIAIEKLKTSP